MRRCFAPDAVLHDPGALAAFSDPQAESGQVIVEKDFVFDACGQRGRLDGRLVNFMASAVGKQLGSNAMALPERLCFPISQATIVLSIV